MKVIYMIKNKVNGKFYIGSTQNWGKRKKEHIKRMRKGINDCGYLQNAWNLYGEENFEFNVIEQVENVKDLIKREQYYMDTLLPQYNIRKIAKSNLGIKLSRETIQKIIEANSKIVLQYDLDGNFLKEWKSAREVARVLEISFSCVSACCLGKRRTVKGFVFQYKDAPKPNRKFLLITHRKFKISDGKTEVITRNLQKTTQQFSKFGLTYRNIVSYMQKNETDFYNFKSFFVERLDRKYPDSKNIAKVCKGKSYLVTHSNVTKEINNLSNFCKENSINYVMVRDKFKRSRLDKICYAEYTIERVNKIHTKEE